MKKTKPRKTRKRIEIDAQRASPSAQRIPLIDAVRGSAVIAMIFYHFGFDLNYLGWIHQDLGNDLRWMTARWMILGSFLLTVGASMALAEIQPASMKLRWKRIGKIAVAAALVTAGSWKMFPNSAIYFGTLHAIALMSLILLVLPMAALPAGILGLGMLVLGNTFSTTAFNHPALAWIGLMTYKPLTEDYVPMLPWFGMCLIGYATMKSLIRRDALSQSHGTQLPRFIVWTGRHSLAIYLLHQPLLLGILIPLTTLIRKS